MYYPDDLSAYPMSRRHDDQGELINLLVLHHVQTPTLPVLQPDILTFSPLTVHEIMTSYVPNNNNFSPTASQRAVTKVLIKKLILSVFLRINLSYNRPCNLLFPSENYANCSGCPLDPTSISLAGCGGVEKLRRAIRRHFKVQFIPGGGGRRGELETPSR